MNKLYAVLLMFFLPLSLAYAANPDADFFQQAAMGGIAEVDAGKLAEHKGGDAAIKKFGAQMVKDHTKANDELKKIAKQQQVTLPKHPDPEHIAMQKKLAHLSGKKFDSTYIEGQVTDHKAVIALFEHEAASGENAKAKAFAVKTLPVLKHHLSMLEQMSGSAAQ